MYRLGIGSVTCKIQVNQIRYFPFVLHVFKKSLGLENAGLAW